MIGDRIKQHRVKNGLTRSEMAKALHSATRTISSYEKGERTPPVKKLLAIATLLGCSVADLTADEPLPLPERGQLDQEGGENMSEPARRPYPVTIVGRLSYEYHDGEDWGEGEHKIPAEFLPEVMALVAELKMKYPHLA